LHKFAYIDKNILGARQRASEDIGAAESAGSARRDIFNTTQKQIYNLMKMDSFPRFLQSSLFKVSLYCRRRIPMLSATYFGGAEALKGLSNEN
jgi:Regulator of G protein signaling domain